MIQSDSLSNDLSASREHSASRTWRPIKTRPRIALALVGALALALVAVFAGPQLLSGGNATSDTNGPVNAQGPAGASGSLATTTDRTDIMLSFGAAHDAESGADFALDAPMSQPAPSTSPATNAQSALETAGRSIISTSTVAIEVDNVPGAIDQLRTVATSAGGFIETLSTTGGADPDRGNVTIRIPGHAFLTTLQRVKELGTVVGETVGSDDVTEQVIDLQARLRSEQAKEVSFLELLSRAESVSDLLSIERELARVRTEIERLTGQLSFIEQRVDLATIHVSFGQPASLAAEPPSASLAVDTHDVEESVVQLKAIVEQVNGEVDSTSISLNNGVLQAFVAVRVTPADFDDTLFRIAHLGDVTAKEVRTPGAASALPESDEASARITVTLNQADDARNWWLWAGIPVGAVALVLLLAVAYRVGGARNRS